MMIYDQAFFVDCVDDWRTCTTPLIYHDYIFRDCLLHRQSFGITVYIRALPNQMSFNLVGWYAESRERPMQDNTGSKPIGVLIRYKEDLVRGLSTDIWTDQSHHW